MRGWSEKVTQGTREEGNLNTEKFWGKDTSGSQKSR